MDVIVTPIWPVKTKKSAIVEKRTENVTLIVVGAFVIEMLEVFKNLRWICIFVLILSLFIIASLSFY